MDITYISFYFKITDYRAFLLKIVVKMALILQSTQNTALSYVCKGWDGEKYCLINGN